MNKKKRFPNITEEQKQLFLDGLLHTRMSIKDMLDIGYSLDMREKQIRNQIRILHNAKKLIRVTNLNDTRSNYYAKRMDLSKPRLVSKPRVMKQ